MNAHPPVTALVLAAGRSSRMGSQKLLLVLEGRRVIDRALDACRAYPTIVVANESLAAHLHDTDTRLVVNAQPERGMAHSFALANRAAPEGDALLLLLGDMPFVSAALSQRIVESAQRSGADVCFPERSRIGGHPVYFSPRARLLAASLTLEGESLRPLRDHPSLKRIALPTDDEGAYRDIDVPADL